MTGCDGDQGKREWREEAAHNCHWDIPQGEEMEGARVKHA